MITRSRGANLPIVSPGGEATIGDARSIGRTLLLFMVGLATYLSLNSWSRLAVGELSFHPYLVLLGIAILTVGLSAFGRLPRRLVWAMVIYFALFVVLTLQAGSAVSEIVKIGTSFLTICSVAVVVRSRQEVRAVSAGLIAAIAVVSTQAILHPTSSEVGFSPVETGNKNSFSLYALPALLLAGHFAIDKLSPRGTRIAFSAGAVMISIGILSTGNRSGYLGLALIAVMLAAKGRRLRDAFLIVLLASTAYLALSNLGSTQALFFRLSDPTTSQSSDDLRKNIVVESISLGLEHPLLGVGPQAVATELGLRLRGGSKLDAHNLLAYNFAGGGFPLLLALVWLGSAYWRRPSNWPPGAELSTPQKDALALARMLVILISVRGYFTEEVLTIPGFTITLGAVLGLVLVSEPGAPGLHPVLPLATEGTDTPTARAGLRHPDLFERERNRREATRLIDPP